MTRCLSGLYSYEYFHDLNSLMIALQASFSMNVSEDGTAAAYTGFFDTEFRGSTENPATIPVTLSTAPDPTGATHWGQQSFLLQPPIELNAGDKIDCSFSMHRRKHNHRLWEVTLHQNLFSKSGEQKREMTHHFMIE